MSQPLTAKERVELRRLHREIGDRDGGGYRDPIRTCLYDDEIWPCPTIRMLDELDEAWAAIERAGSAVEPLGLSGITATDLALALAAIDRAGTNPVVATRLYLELDRRRRRHDGPVPG